MKTYQITIEITDIAFSVQLSLNSDAEGQLVPLLKGFAYDLKINKIDISNSWIEGSFIENGISLIESMMYLSVNEFGIPMINMILPTLS